MSARYRYAAVGLLLACVGCAADGRDANDEYAAESTLTMGREIAFTGAGGAEIGTALELPDGSILATTDYAKRIWKFRPDGTDDVAFGDRGFVESEAIRLWRTGDDVLVLTQEGEGAIAGVSRRRTSDGSLVPSFGTNGKVALPHARWSHAPDDATLAAAYDAARDKVVVLVAREWQVWRGVGSPRRLAPRKLEILEVDGASGAIASSGTHVLAAWDPMLSTDTNAVRVFEIHPAGDGALLVLVRASINELSGYQYFARDDWSVLRLASNEAPQMRPFATSAFETSVLGSMALPDGAFDLVLGGEFRGVSASRNDKKLLRVRVDAAGTPATPEVLGPFVPEAARRAAPFVSVDCYAGAFDGNDFLLAESLAPNETLQLTRYAPGKPPVAASLSQPNRCVRRLHPQVSGKLLATTWNTRGPSWFNTLTTLVP